MVRFSMNRWLGFVMTLCLLTASFTLLSAPASAALLTSSTFMLNPSDPISGGGANAGDPDVPMGPGDGRTSLSWRSIGRVEATRTVSVQETRLAGDVTVSGCVVMNHVRLLLLGLRGLYLGF